MSGSGQIREKFLEFFKEKGHGQIPPASLIPENDPTVLFTTAGMHPLVPYLLGEKHPMGPRLVNFQKCLRTDDIGEVGDSWHLTFFEMMGNWSLGFTGKNAPDSDVRPLGKDGPYWKKEAIEWSWEFLTSPKWLGLDRQNIYVSVFEGDPVPSSGGAGVPRDDESIEIWKEVFARDGIEAKVGKGERIGLYGRDKNWWGPAGKTGPCGPDTEMFYDSGREHDLKFGPACDQNCDCGRFVEIWNNVFMQYAKTFDGDYISMTYKNIDTGMGLERMEAVLAGSQSVFEIDSFLPIIRKIEELSGKNYAQDNETTRAMRVIADHARSAVFILGDERGVVPSNLEQGYVLRRLIRRAIRCGYQLGAKSGLLKPLAEIIVREFGDFYPELKVNEGKIYQELEREEAKFGQTIAGGLKQIEVMARKTHRLENILTQFREGDFDDDNDRFFAQSIAKESWVKNGEILNRILATKDPAEIKNLADNFISGFQIAGKFIFDLYARDGFPPEMVAEVARSVEKPDWKAPMVNLPFSLDLAGFEKEFKRHQDISRAGIEQRFKGGLADHEEATARLHTATHLLHAALRRVLGEHVVQKGSNITAARLRFDFSHPAKMTAEEIKKTEGLINWAIQRDFPVVCEERNLAAAKAEGALGIFESRYGDKVKIYNICAGGESFSKEICGGPHAKSTAELGRFKIIKEEASSAGVRRIRAALE